MKKFKSLLIELDIVLRQYNPIEYKKLQPPLPDVEIDKKLSELGIDDTRVKALFQWKNGEKEGSNTQITLSGGFLSLESIKEDKGSSLCEYFDSLLIPLISENGEEMLLFNNNSGKNYGKLYLYSVPYLYIEHPISYFDSLETMIKTTIDAYKMGIYNYDTKKKWLYVDGEKFNELAKKYNKNSVYWTDHNCLKFEDWYEI